jgi:hypothetical protein
VTAFRDSDILNTLVRMVVPMRREFGHQLDVSQFLRDHGYAQAVLGEALRSGDSRLRDYAAYVQARLSGARLAAPPPATAPASAQRTGATAAAPASPDAAAPAPTREDELRARVLRKYTGGLR